MASSAIFGAKDKIVQGLTEAWCIAKIRRLIGPLGPPVNNSEYEEEFLVAEELGSTFEHPDTKVETQFITVGTLRQELEKLPGPKVSSELLDFIESLLVIDHTKRPTALEALRHSYLQSLPQQRKLRSELPCAPDIIEKVTRSKNEGRAIDPPAGVLRVHG